jgi:hypothetical protein
MRDVRIVDGAVITSPAADGDAARRLDALVAEKVMGFWFDGAARHLSRRAGRDGPCGIGPTGWPLFGKPRRSATPRSATS